MYRTCLHCHAPLGSNEIVEHFAVGRRLAFDCAKGRLWVVCPSCRRWNLTPLEERWEAIEECEKAFRGAAMRESTDNISVAKTREGLELVRIGAPLVPEMAAWRYGRELRRRWLTRGVPSTAAFGTLFVLQTAIQGDVLPLAIGAGALIALPAAAYFGFRHHSRVKIALPNGKIATIHGLNVVTARQWRLSTSRLVAFDDGSWGVQHDSDSVIATGGAATHFLRGIMTAMNYLGARRKRIDEATDAIAAAGGSQAFVALLARAAAEARAPINELPDDFRLALEMALHEDAERKASDGDFAALEEEWQLAESIAAIADDMFLPMEVVDAHRRLKAAL